MLVEPLLGGLPGHVAGLVAPDLGVVQEVVAEGASQEVHWVSGSGPRRKRIRLNRKTPAHLAGHMYGIHCVTWSILKFQFLIVRGGEAIWKMGDMFLLRSGLGWVDSLGFSAGFLLSLLLHAGLRCCAHTHTFVCV